MPTNTKKTLSREYCMKYLFHLLSLEKLNFGQTDPVMADLSEFLESYGELDEEHPDNTLDKQSLEYGNWLVHGILESREELINKVQSKLKNKTFSQLDIMTKAILLTGAFELAHSETPFQVVIHESINLASKFSKSESVRFINGILDALAKD